MTNTIQKKFKVSSTQLLYQSCPYQAITLFIIGPFLDGLLTNQNVFAFAYTPQVLVRIQSTTPKGSLATALSCHFLCVSLISDSNHNIVYVAVLHCSILPDICLCKLQYIFGYWKDVCSNLSGPWTFEDMPCFGIWLHSPSRSI